MLISIRLLLIIVSFRGSHPLVLDKRAIARVCVEKRDDVIIACLGVYVNLRWILTSKACYPRIKRVDTVTLFMGSSKMNCKNGKRNKAKEVVTAGDTALIRLASTFTLSPHISTMPFHSGKKRIKNCKIFSAHKPRQEARSCSTDTNVDEHKISFVPCDGDKGKKNCGSAQTEGHTPCDQKLWQIGMSPIVCRDRLVGFLEKKPKNVNKVKFKRVEDDLEVINKITANCCG